MDFSDFFFYLRQHLSQSCNRFWWISRWITMSWEWSSVYLRFYTWIYPYHRATSCKLYWLTENVSTMTYSRNTWLKQQRQDNRPLVAAAADKASLSSFSRFVIRFLESISIADSFCLREESSRSCSSLASCNEVKFHTHKMQTSCHLAGQTSWRLMQSKTS